MRMKTGPAIPTNPMIDEFPDLFSDAERSLYLLAFLSGQMEELKHDIVKDQIDVNAFQVDPNGSAIVQIPVRRDLIIQSIVAQWTNIFAATTTPPIPATGVAQSNYNNYSVNVTVNGGTVTVIAVNGSATGLTSGTVTVPAGGSITLTYSVIPTSWVWAAATATPPTSVTLTVGDRVIPLPPYLNFFNPTDMRMQVNKDATIKLVSSPATSVYLEIGGYADFKKLDRQ